VSSLRRFMTESDIARVSQAGVSSSGESARVGSLSHAVASVRGREKVPANKGGRVSTAALIRQAWGAWRIVSHVRLAWGRQWYL